MSSTAAGRRTHAPAHRVLAVLALTAALAAAVGLVRTATARAATVGSSELTAGWALRSAEPGLSRRLFHAYFLSATHSQHNLVRIEIRNEIHHDRHDREAVKVGRANHNELQFADGVGAGKRNFCEAEKEYLYQN